MAGRVTVMPGMTGKRGPFIDDLSGIRITDATFADGTHFTVEDRVNDPLTDAEITALGEDQAKLYRRLQTEPWTGAVYFPKKLTTTESMEPTSSDGNVASEPPASLS